MFIVTFADGFVVRVTGNMTVAELMERVAEHGKVTSIENSREPRAFNVDRIQELPDDVAFGRRPRAFSMNDLDPATLQ